VNESMTKDELINEIALKSNLDKDDVLRVLNELDGFSRNPSEESIAGVEDSSGNNEDSATMAGSIVFACPECGAVISALPSSAGEDGECPYCKSKINIPQKSADAPTVGAVPAPKSAVQSDGDAEGFVQFACRECGQEMECAASMAGLTAGCPACGSKMVIPAVSTIDTKPAAVSDNNGVDDDFSDVSSSMTMRIDLMDL